MTDRRYADNEVREIFSLATTGDARDPALPTDADGLTLQELQRIGQEVGIEPARVASAAARLDARGKVAPVRRSFGLPVGVTRVVDLPRAPTDREWEQLVAQFRTTFGAQGKTTTSGGLRDWSNGNLHVSIEPTAHGEQLRMSTVSDDGMLFNTAGAGLGVMSVIVGGVIAADGSPAKALMAFGVFGGLGLSAFITNVLRLPGWARERDRQMEAIAEHAVKLLR